MLRMCSRLRSLLGRRSTSWLSEIAHTMRRLANEIKPEFWLMGEVIHGDYSRWANPEMLHLSLIHI